ncbi:MULTISPECIES: thermonuclease family protein [unclassified Pseudomonas]|uniref:thermonuclease family protein n=1 Tax=unclassified Pseudomonas TaxID=196821 RepID=UPI000B834FCA|nr:MULTISPECIES: thermonuclease family protein [unclassified Pseudomonas]QVM96487.1 thermonuclease family protein [Pseudomonas sp. SORT22]UVL56651.1 thermonuclease family protein [Pseudomonas sp. B21-035]
MRDAGPMGLALLLKKASLVGAFFMGAIWQLPALAFCAAPVDAQVVSVRQVVDGDTLRLNDGRSVRLIGINAPEIGRKGRSSEAFAEAARQRLQALVKASGGQVGLVPGVEARDKYGRTLAHVYGRSGDNFEAQLLSEGLGYRVAVAPNVALAGCQAQAERAARQAGKGLWRQSPLTPASAVRQSGFALISGKVMDIQRNRGGIWIEIDDSLVLQVPARLQRNFPSSFFTDLKGRSIEARGWVLDRSRKGGLKPGQQRWLLPLTDPSMLERVER